MSGPAIHTLIAQELPKTFQEEGCPAAQSQVEPLEKHVPFRNFGSMGPDFLFFDFRFGGLTGLVIEAAEMMEAFERKVEEAFPLLQDLRDAKDRVDEEIRRGLDTFQTTRDIQQMVSDVRHLISVLQALTLTAGSHLLTETVNAFEALGHVMQDGDDPADWGPFDALHYRRSGQFATRLLEASRDDPELHAYAIGYLSHYAADTVGHPYVNLLVPGPFRTYSQRHKVVENFQDTWAVGHLGGGEFVRSALHRDFRFPGEQLPEKLKKLFSESYRAVYGTSLGDPITPAETDAAYRLWYHWFCLTTETGEVPPHLPRLDFPLTSAIREAWDDFERRVRENTGSRGSSGGDFSWRGVANFFNRVRRAVQSALFLAAAGIDFILGLFTSAGREIVHFFLSQIYDALYAAYRFFREGLAYSGLLFPYLSTTRQAKALHLVDPRQPDAMGRLITAQDLYPVRGWNDLFPFFREKHLTYPPTNLEGPPTFVAPESYLSQQADFYMNGPDRTDPELLDQVRRANSPAPDHQDVASLGEALERRSLGNALRLTTTLYCDWAAGTPNAIPDLNLDGDRGMAHPAWEVRRGSDPARPVPDHGDVVVTLLTPEDRP